MGEIIAAEMSEYVNHLKSFLMNVEEENVQQKDAAILEGEIS